MVKLRIRDIRKSLGWSQTDLGLRAGIRTATVSDVEKGKVSPSIATLEAIAAAFNCGVLDLIETDHEDSSDAAVVIAALAEMEPEERAGVVALIQRAAKNPAPSKG